MKGLSKSKYTTFCQCPKALWLSVYNPLPVDPTLQARFDMGHEVGYLAMGLFGDSVDVTVPGEDGRLNLVAMIERTKDEMARCTNNICEASFAKDNNYCAVDILRRNGDGWDIYEVKSSTYKGDDKDTAESLLVYTRDIAYQRWLLEQCGVKVKGCYLVRLNSFYVRDKELDIQQLFHVKNVDDLVANEFVKVPHNVGQALKTLQLTAEPAETIDLHCNRPYPCAYFGHCTQGIVEPNVFNLYRMDFKKKCELYNQGKIGFKDLVNEKLSETQRIQVETYLNDTELVTPQEIRTFLQKLTYPLYFLDFETMQMAVPEYEGTKPYQQIPFQYSLHWIEEEGGDLKHSEFLGNSVDDPRRALAEKLCSEIPMGKCTTAYNKGFECKRLEELAEAFPDLSAHLLDISKNIVDLIEPFRKKMVYLPEMNGSFSIKQVLPALRPDDPELNYDNLDGSVHNGGEAMNIYPLIAKMPPEEAEETHNSLLKYCELDTLAMVRIWEKLKEIVNS